MDIIGSYDIVKVEDGYFFVDYFTGEILFSEDGKSFVEEIASNKSTEKTLFYDKSKSRFDNLLHSYYSENENEVLHIIIIPTYNCNFKCSYCYECKNNFFMTEETINSIKKFILSEYKKYNSIFIEWFGGEPLLAKKQIKSIMEFVNYLQIKNNFKLYSHVTTNGSLLNLEYLSFLLELGINSFTITIDGIAKWHDKQRMYMDGSGSYDKIMENLLSLHKTKYDFSIKLRCNLTANNIHGVDQLLEYWTKAFSNDKRFSDIDIREVSKYTNNVKLNDDFIKKSTANEFKFFLLKKYANKGLFDKSSLHYTTPGSCICYASEKNSIIISPTGNILKCTIALESEEYNIVGKLTKTGKLEYNSKINFWIDIKSRFTDKCEKCSKLVTCFNSTCPIILKRKEYCCPDFFCNISNYLDIMKIYVTNERSD